MKILYLRCNGGHYYRPGVYPACALGCPFDGWSFDNADEADRLLAVFASLSTPSIDGLRSHGISDEMLARVLIIEFGDERSAFDAMAPNIYLHQGKQMLWHEVPLELY